MEPAWRAVSGVNELFLMPCSDTKQGKNSFTPFNIHIIGILGI